MQRVEVVVGAQYGSEGKGHVTAQLVQRAVDEALEAKVLGIDVEVINVRVAGPNAGHTVYDENGVKFALRSIPVGAAVSDHVTLYIAPGSEVELEVVEKEVSELRAAGHVLPKLFISGEATLLTEAHKGMETMGHLTERLGSTGKGIGAARADRLWRVAERVQDSKDAVDRLTTLGFILIEPDGLYSTDKIAANRDQHIIIEGTQGYGLGLHAGFYPQCTSSDCRAIDFLAMAGVSPWRIELGTFAVWVVARVYPIRVAGNSGPLEGETSWEELGLPQEYTTVTQKVRRVGAFDPDMLYDAVQANGGMKFVKLAITMIDQKFPAFRQAQGEWQEVMRLFVETDQSETLEHAVSWLNETAIHAQASVGMITTSPVNAVFFDE